MTVIGGADPTEVGGGVGGGGVGGQLENDFGGMNLGGGGGGGGGGRARQMLPATTSLTPCAW